jgi:oxygen-independent coproporphyrinogen-3 oxidase
MVEPFALYVHVPYCRHVCPYCDFNVYAAARPAEAGYAAGLVAELTAHAAREPWSGRRVKTVYLGGGTPSLFSPAAIDGILTAVAARFGLVDGAEITLEANPGTLSQAALAGYRATGVNRLSLGAQSFHPHHLQTLGRDHGPDDVRAAVDAARAAGFENLSLDLIFGIPGETLADWEMDLAHALEPAPAHVSTYALTYEPGTPFHTWRARGRLRPVDDDLEAAMAELMGTRLGAAGFERYEISSYARPGFAARHNLSYWDGSDYLGLGAGAHAFSQQPAPGVRSMNERSPERYLAAVGATGTAVASIEPLTEATARAEFCFTGLRQTAGIDVASFRRRFDTELAAAFPHVLGLIGDGLLDLIGGRLRLTPRGLAFADTVSATFV